ncbi:hypothetical protein [Ruegeria arenilitoris]|uniref:hypothetical protein n=1 Tax=Ruegeria arenilitoris TaxID=1173585 RepID=UPI00147D268C|nr:hypothetical protein [Ruegeria arenilitoris]
MTPSDKLGWILDTAALAAAVVLIATVIWVSDRAIEITDEAYYILSGAHPKAITAYISAQHWVLAPLWAFTGDLQSFRLLGTAILTGSVTLLAYGTYRVAETRSLLRTPPVQVIVLAAAGSIGALLYVSTISPSPSYNLLASAGGYAALGLAFICATSTNRAVGVVCALLCGVALTITFINKPPAGVCCALLALVALLMLRERRGTWLCIVSVLAGGFLSLSGLVALNWQSGAMTEHLQTGLALFRQVQTEPIVARLWRYAVTMALSILFSLIWFAPALALCLYMLRDPRRWMPSAVMVLVLVSIFYGEHYLGGRTQYQTQVEALVALLVLILTVTISVWSANRRILGLIVLLICLPYAVAMGTGNSMFTQVIVTAGSWPVIAVLLAQGVPNCTTRRKTAQGLALLMMLLIVVQVFSSFSRDPYHLDQPLFAQTQLTEAPVLGAVRVDTETLRMLADLKISRDTCKIAPGAAFFGLYNVPGLSLLLEAIPPVSPWVTNPQQLDTLFGAWKPEGRTVLALSANAQMSRDNLPEVLQPLENKFDLCGTLIVPFSDEEIEIWASKNTKL